MLAGLVGSYLSMPEHRGKYRIARGLFKLADGHAIRTPYGVTMRCDGGDATSFFALSGQPNVDYRDVYQEVVQLKKGQAFIDVGANAGIFSMVAARVLEGTGPVIAIEPSLRNFRRLLDNAYLNNAQDFYPFRVAIGDRTERLQLTEDPTHTGKSHLTSTGGVPILKVTFSDLLPLIAPMLEGRDVVIKMDVEGAEAMVARSMAPLLVSPRILKVVVEVDREHLARFDSTPEELYGLFEAVGFKARLGLTAGGHFNEVFER